MSTSRRKLLQMAGTCAATGFLGVLGKAGHAQPAPSDLPGGCRLGRQPPNPIEEFVCCDARSDFANEGGLPSPVEEPWEIISDGYIWTEGPVWVGDESGYLLFSDVPGNGIYQWDGQSTHVFLKPSGSDIFPTPFHVREDGTNGLALGRGGLIACDSGNRSIVRIDLETRERTVLADNYNGKRFNSTNDVVVADNGDIYFTDPATGINANYRDQLLEFDYSGVFRIDTDNRVHLIADNLRVNGVALSPDNRTLYVTDRSGWVAIDLDEQGMPVRQRLFVSREMIGGGADGMQVDHAGRLWTSGPGGIHLFSPSGEHIGFTPVENRLANCNFGADGYLYVTNCSRVIRAKIKPEFA